MPPYGSLVCISTPKGKRIIKRVEENQDWHTNDGILSMSDLAQCNYGSEVLTSLKIPYRIQEPVLYDLIKGIKRQTQIIYPKDIAYICMRLGIGEGRTIIEAGSGSGGLTLALSWYSGLSGHVHSYEAREEFHKLALKNLKWAGVGKNVTLYHRDISDGFTIQNADALFLDVREPWEYLDHAIKAIKPGAALGFLVPTVEQISRLLLELEKRPFDETEVCEILIRRWKPVTDRLRPKDRMVAHTGFLIFTKYQECSEHFNSLKPQGTRERKQEAARQKRLAAASDEE